MDNAVSVCLGIDQALAKVAARIAAEVNGRLKYERLIRFRVGKLQTLRVEALVEFSRPKLVEVAGKIFDHTGRLAATSSGKYVPTSLDEHLEYMDTFLEDTATDEASRLLRGLPPAPKVEVQVMDAAKAPSTDEAPRAEEAPVAHDDDDDDLDDNDQPSGTTESDEERAST